MIYDVAEKKVEIIVEESNIALLSASTYEFSADKKFILTASKLIKIFRHSFVASWAIYDVDKKETIPVTIGGQNVLISLVKFNPVDNSMIVVYNNNIYYKATPTSEEIQITTDGSKDIYNGVPDWVNEEEVFSSNSATWFSPDGKKIAFLSFNDADVPVMALPIYGEIGNPAYQYPQIFTVNYPKVAAKNPVVKLFYVDLATVATTVVKSEIPVPSRFLTSQIDHLITSISWATDNNLIVVFMNRVQSQGEIQKCAVSTATPTCSAVLNLDVTGGWVDFFTAPFYNKEGNRMAFIGSSNGYRHVLSLDLSNNQVTARSSGNFEASEILSFNKEQNLIIFAANTVEDHKAKHIYAVKDEANAEKVCLSCNFPATHTYFNAELSKNGNHLAISSLGPEVPETHLYSLNLNGTNVGLKDQVELISNSELKEALKGRKIPTIKYDMITLDNGSESAVMMILPGDLDESKQHPMIVDVYGGPDSESVTNKWSVEWGSYLASAHNFIYVKIDGRGSGLRGDKNMFALYRALGTVEVEDQIDTAKKLQEKYSFIDPKNSAIWGWSYGGYVSGMSITKDDKDVFKCAVSVAPGEFENFNHRKSL